MHLFDLTRWGVEMSDALASSLLAIDINLQCQKLIDECSIGAAFFRLARARNELYNIYRTRTMDLMRLTVVVKTQLDDNTGNTLISFQCAPALTEICLF